MADVITHKATTFIDAHQAEPFFLFFSTHDVHVPRVPHSRFTGKSGLGYRGDAMLQLDWCVGQILDKLDQLELTDNTLVIFSSDNGPVLDDGYHDQANEKLGMHDPNGNLRGGKYSLFEGGTRVPLVLRWPGKIKPGTTSDALVGQIDFAASLASLVDAEVPDKACGDSRNSLPALLGQSDQGRPHLLHEAGQLALRVGNWKYIPKANVREKLGPWITTKIEEPGALFDLRLGVEEQENVASRNPQQLASMRELHAKLRQNDDQPELIGQ
jgi:arylsulfatase A-like enzyme